MPTRGDRSLSPNAAKNKAHQEAESRARHLAQIESQLLQLNIERDQKKDELSKIPQHAKTGAQIRRREQLEQDTQILNKQIATVKRKLKDLSAI